MEFNDLNVLAGDVIAALEKHFGVVELEQELLAEVTPSGEKLLHVAEEKTKAVGRIEGSLLSLRKAFETYDLEINNRASWEQARLLDRWDAMIDLLRAIRDKETLLSAIRDERKSQGKDLLKSLQPFLERRTYDKRGYQRGRGSGTIIVA